MAAPATMQSEAMRRSGAMAAPATMQWGRLEPRSGEGDEAMRRSGATATAGDDAVGAPRAAQRRGGRSDDEERRG